MISAPQIVVLGGAFWQEALEPKRNMSADRLQILTTPERALRQSPWWLHHQDGPV